MSKDIQEKKQTGEVPAFSVLTEGEIGTVKSDSEQSVASVIKRTEHSESRGVGEGNSSVAGGAPKGGQ